MSQSSLAMSYLPVLIFFIMALGMAIFMTIIPFVIGKSRPNSVKLSTYECGFKEFSDSRTKFDIRFYLVAMLFIIFDLEVTFLFPWSVTLKEVGVESYMSMMVFLFILTLGFVYEWKKGALEWD